MKEQMFSEANLTITLSQLLRIFISVLFALKKFYLSGITKVLNVSGTRGFIAQEKITLSHLFAIKIFLKRSDLTI